MPLRPKPKPSKLPLVVYSTTPWGKRITYRTPSGKEVEVNNYQEARDHAEANGYAGIKIERVSQC